MAAQQSLRRLPNAGARLEPQSILESTAYQHGNEQYEYQTQVSNHQTPNIQPCTTISTSEQYDLAKVIGLFYAEGLRSASVILPGEIAHVHYPCAPGCTADVLVTSNGSVVAWGMNEKDVLDKIVPMIKDAEIGSYSEPESEDMDYIEEIFEPEQHSVSSSLNDSHNLDERHDTQELILENGQQVPEQNVFLNNHENSISEESHRVEQDHQHVVDEDEPVSISDITNSHSACSSMDGDVIIIRGSTYIERLLAKAAFSSGLARSTKLANLEGILDEHINTTKKYIDNLASGRELGIRGKTVLRLTGQLLRIRGQLNLYSELIETPDLYWSEPDLESLYSLISRKLDVSPRIAILNKKLDYASESLSTLRSHISEENGVRLEWMIIILIMVEVAFEITHFVEKYYGKSEKLEKSDKSE